MKYKVNDLVMMRTPLQSLNDYEVVEGLMANIKNIEEILLFYPELQEGIAVASLDLFEAIKKRNIGSKQKEAIIKYFMRSIVRAGPFGFFSGIARCQFNEKTNIRRISKKSATKMCTVDYEWFYGVVERLEKNTNILRNSYLKFNHQCYISGERVINPYMSGYGKASKKDTNVDVEKSRIRNSRQIEYIMKRANDWIVYEELLKDLYEFNEKNVPVEILENFITQLIDNEYIITDLRVPLSEKDPLELLLIKLKNMKQHLDDESNELYTKLLNIDSCRKRYCLKPLGDNINLYDSLCLEMRKVYESKSYLASNLRIELAQNHLGKNVKETMDSFLELLVALSTDDNESFQIKEYKDKFIQTYGVNREVPILHLLDATIGLGNPYESTKANVFLNESPKKKLIKEYINDKIVFALKNGLSVINITEEDKNYFQSLSKSNLAFSNSFELNVRILAKSNEDIDNGSYRIELAPSPASSKCGKLNNRFQNVMDEDTQIQFKRIYDEIIKKDSLLLADTSFLPKGGRINNICNGKVNYKYSLDCGLDSVSGTINVCLSDLVVGYNSDVERLYIKYTPENRIISIMSDSMLNRMVDHPIIRFIWEVSYAYEIQPAEQLFSITNYDFRYTPEINYKKVTIVPETWKIYKTDFSDINSLNTFEKEFRELIKKWEIPRFIYFMILDRFLFIDTEKSICIKFLWQEVKINFKSNEPVILRKIDNKNEVWVGDLDNLKYHSEFTIQCINDFETIVINPINNKMVSIDTKSDVEINKHSIVIDNNDRLFFPYDNGWLYFKIYMESVRANDFIIEEIEPLLEILKQNNLISNCFFIRYADPDFHIRLRIKFNDAESQRQASGIVGQWLKQNYSKRKFKNYIVAAYDREIERYGGVEVIDHAEKLFELDTLLIMNILKLKKENKNFDIEYMSFICMYDYLHIMFNDTSIEETVLEKVISHKEFRKEFREKGKQYTDIISKKELAIDDKLLALYYERENAIIDYVKLINVVDSNGRLMNSKNDISMSIMHMYCNRLNGDRVWERKMLALIRHALHSYNSKKKILDGHVIY